MARSRGADHRAAGRGRGPSRLEPVRDAAGIGFHERVRTGFAALAAAAPDRWVVVDGVGAEDEVAARVLSAVRSRGGDA